MKRLKADLRHKNLVSALALAVVLGGTFAYAPAAQAQSAVSQEFDFNIPAQSLANSLNAFGVQTGLQVSANGNDVRDLTGNAVQGRMSVQEALTQLTAGLGIFFEVKPDGSVLISSSETGADTTVMSPITINEAMAGDRHANAADRADSKYVSGVDLSRRNASNVKKVFAGESSISVGGGIPASQKVYVRGVEEQALAVTIDGARQVNKTFHHNGNNLIDPVLLKAVRVDPTVAPADAGPGALAGGIVYETVDVADLLAPGDDTGGFTKISYNSNGNTFANSGAAFGRSGGMEVLGFVSMANGDNYEGGDDADVSGTAADVMSFLGKFAYEAEGHRFEFTAERVNDDADRPFRANIRELVGRPAADRNYELERDNLIFNYSMTRADGWLDPRLTVAYGASKVSVLNPFGSVGRTTSVSATLENDFHLSDKDKVTAGIDMYHDENRYRDFTSNPAIEKSDNVGVFAQARLEPIDRFKVSLGARYDRNELTGLDGTEIDNAGLSGNASLAFEIIDGVTLKGGYSNVFGGLSLAESFVYNAAWDYSTGVDKATRAENYSVGAEVDMKGVTFDAAVFRTDVENARKESFRGGPLVRNDFRAEGFEVGLGYRWENGFINTSYTDTEFLVDGALADSFTSQYLGFLLGRVAAVEVEHSFTDMGVTVGGTVDAAFDNDDMASSVFGERSVDGYTSLSTYAEYRPEGMDFLTLRGEVNNLTNEEYADRSTYGQEFTTVAPILEPGRSVVVSLRVDF